MEWPVSIMTKPLIPSSLVGCVDQYHTAEIFHLVVLQIDADHQAAEGMTDKVHLMVWRGATGFNLFCNFLLDLFRRLPK